MQITMNDSRITSIAQLRDFLKGVEQIPFSLEQESIEKKYEFINKTLKRFLYRRLSRKDKKVVVWYLRKVTGYKKERLYQLVGKAEKGKLNIIPYHRIHPHKIYTSFAIKLLEKTDEAHLRLSEDATKEILRREYEVFGKKDYHQSYFSRTHHQSSSLSDLQKLLDQSYQGTINSHRGNPPSAQLWQTRLNQDRFSLAKGCLPYQQC